MHALVANSTCWFNFVMPTTFSHSFHAITMNISLSVFFPLPVLSLLSRYHTASLWWIWVLYLDNVLFQPFVHLQHTGLLEMGWETKFWPLGLEVKPYGVSSHWIGVPLNTRCLANPSETQQPLALFLGLDLCLSSLCSALSKKQGKENLHVGGLYGWGRNPAEVLTSNNPTLFLSWGTSDLSWAISCSYGHLRGHGAGEALLVLESLLSRNGWTSVGQWKIVNSFLIICGLRCFYFPS